MLNRSISRLMHRHLITAVIRQAVQQRANGAYRNNLFVFKTIPNSNITSIEANVFIHGYSAGHTDEDRKALAESIPGSNTFINIFAFWQASHVTRFNSYSRELIGKSAILGGAPAAAATTASDRAAHFIRIRSRAEAMGKVLLEQLNQYVQLHHPEIEKINLIGHSLGGRLVINSLLTYTNEQRLKINDVLLMAAAVNVMPVEAKRMRDLIQGRLINAYSKADKILLMNFGETCLGRNEFKYFENIEMVNFGHTDYWERLSQVLQKTRLKTFLREPSTCSQTPDTSTATQHQPLDQHSEDQSMTLELSTPDDIYLRINDELTYMIDSLSTSSSDTILDQAQSNARSLLVEHQTQLRNELTELEKNAEWNTFTIAFYGETGAGKSTIIETLRILLNEPSKLANQKVFRELQAQYDESERDAHRLQQAIEQIDAKLSELAKQLTATLERYEQPHRMVLAAIDLADTHFNELKQRLGAALQRHEELHDTALETVKQLQAVITERKRTASLWQRLLNLVRKIPEEFELGQALTKLSEATTARNNAADTLLTEQQQGEQERLDLQRKVNEIFGRRDIATTPLIAQQAEAEQHKLDAAQQRQAIEDRLEQLLTELEKQADGEIIGDGSTDFTRKNHRYDFKLNDQPFALLDVPGIEGKENLVLSEIERAVQTAHAVFYVTNKAAPPQTGSEQKGEQKKGALEKIKEHLGAQTEVWTIFNKKITNPKRSLADLPLINKDENAGLAALSEKMREQLGENYRGVFPLTAKCAFLASSDHFAPNSKNARDRSKFLVNFCTDELLEKSGVRAFLEFLGDPLLSDCEAKITRANFNKANAALNHASAILDGAQSNFAELSAKLKQDGRSAKSQLSSSFKALEKRLGARGQTLIHDFSSNVRNKIYAHIEYDISNDHFKDLLKDEIESEQKKLNNQLPESLSKEIGRFQNDAKDIIERFETQAEELMTIYGKMGNTKLDDKFHFEIKIDNGIKVAGLVASLIGLALAPFTGGASLWLAAASAIGTLVSIGKALWSALSSDYKKSQQRKSTDENLRNITLQLGESFRDGLKVALPKMQQIISTIEQAIETPSKQAAAQAQALARSAKQMKVLSRQIENAGKRQW